MTRLGQRAVVRARVRELAGLAMFAPLKRRELRAIVQAAAMVRVQADQTVTAEDDIANGTYLVINGRLSVIKAGEIVGTLGAGDLLGEIGVLAGRRTATVLADIDSEFLFLPADVVARLREELPGFRTALDEAARKRLNRDRYTE